MKTLIQVLAFCILLPVLDAVKFPDSIRTCCMARGLPESAKCKITAGAHGADGKFHVFADNLYVRVSGVRPNGMPVIDRKSYPVRVEQAFPGLNLSHVRSAVKFNHTKILIVGQKERVEFDESTNRIGKRHVIDNGNKSGRGDGSTIFGSEVLSIPFSLPFGSYNLREVELESHAPGLPSPVFFGCPITFCWSIQFDDAMVYEGKLRVFAGDFYWILPITDLPLMTPTPESAIEIKGMHSHIDAITDVGMGQQFLYFKDESVYFMKDERTLVKKQSIEEFLFGKKSGHPVENVDAAFYHTPTGHLFIFRDSHYYEMERSVDGNWKIVYPKERLIVSDFKINVQDVDAAFMIKDRGIILKNSWIFTLPDKKFLFPMAAYAASLAAGSSAEGVGLFDTKESCGMSQQEFDHMRLLDANEDGRRSMAALSDKPETPNCLDPKSYWIGVLVICVGMLIVIIVVLVGGKSGISHGLEVDNKANTSVHVNVPPCRSPQHGRAVHVPVQEPNPVMKSPDSESAIN